LTTTKKTLSFKDHMFWTKVMLGIAGAVIIRTLVFYLVDNIPLYHYNGQITVSTLSTLLDTALIGMTFLWIATLWLFRAVDKRERERVIQ
jgi:hypothetical protein